jgi:glycosyltransferase involved in cell wall biosynthesis
MRIRRQEQLAAAVRECSELLRTQEASQADVATRLEEVEAQMRKGVRLRVGKRTWVLHRSWSVRRAVRRWTTPRLGLLVHHEPMTLTVPAAYARERPLAEPPMITIVTPSFNQAHFLKRTINSVLGQQYPRLEYIVQDGASTDGTTELLGACSARVDWRSEPDEGQADGINRGFNRSTGEIMAYLNSDDLLLPGALMRVARFFRDHPEVDAIYGHRVLIDEDDQRIGSWIVPQHNDDVLRWADFVPQETLFWRREIWDRSGGAVDASFAYALDWDLLLRFVEAGARIVRIPRFLGAFRIHDAQKTTAHHTVGELEVARLRQRSLGREVTQEEVMERVAWYLRRHVMAHLAQGVREAVRPNRLDVLPYFEQRC